MWLQSQKNTLLPFPFGSPDEAFYYYGMYDVQTLYIMTSMDSLLIWIQSHSKKSDG